MQNLLGHRTSDDFPIALDQRQRALHCYAAGGTGVGKSTLLENLAFADMEQGNGLSFLDPHGTTAEALLDAVPPHRIKDVIYLDPTEEHPVKFNPFSLRLPPRNRMAHAVAISLLFKPLFPDTWGESRMQYFLSAGLHLLLDNPVIATKDGKKITYEPVSFLHLSRVYRDGHFRRRLMKNCANEVVIKIFNEEFKPKSKKQQDEIVSPIENKIGQFIADPLIREVITGKPTINFRAILDERKIFICNLSKDMGELQSRFLGGMVSILLKQAAMMRKHRDIPHYKYIDEFQLFSNESFAGEISEVRKFGLYLTLANQYGSQLEDTVADAIESNVGNFIIFRVGPKDAKNFAPLLTQPSAPVPEVNLIQQDNHHAHVRIIENGATATYQIKTIPSSLRTGSRKAALAWSRGNYTRKS